MNTFMEFHEKLQELRKGKGLTQEELAEQLYVSRTAISKWESGRGFPNIESLKAIAKLFGVSVDALLSGEEILAIAENDRQEKERTIRDLVFGLLDCGVALLLFLPFFGQKGPDGAVEAVSLLAAGHMQPYLKITYVAFVLATSLLGVLTLAFQNCHRRQWLKCKGVLSLGFSIFGVLLFTISQQPYGAVFTFVFLIIKVFVTMKKR